MPRRQADEGENPYDIRTGLGVPNLRGMNRHDDPAGIKPNEHHLLVNVRLDGSEIAERPGSTTEENTGWPGCINGLIEIDETGVGFWVTPCPETQGSGTGPSDEKVLGNINEEAADDFVRYNDQGDFEPPWTNGSVVITFRYDPEYQNTQPWQSVVDYRRKYLQLGQRFVPKEQDPDTSEPWDVLWALDFPSKPSDQGPVGYESYLELWNTATFPDREVSSFATDFERVDDAVLGTTRIAERLYIGTNDGRVFVYDGSTLIESLDMGGTNDYWVRLGSWPGGIFAVGSNGTDSVVGAAKAYVLPDGATSWTQVTLPTTDFRVNAMHSFNGKLYIFELEAAVTRTRGCRLYVYNGETTLPAHSYEWPFTTVTNYYISAGLPFIYRNQLYVCTLRADGFQARIDLWRRTSDSSWSSVMELNWQQDFGFSLNWVQVINQRIIMAGNYIEKNIGQTGYGDGRNHYVVYELLPWLQGFRIIVESPATTEWDTIFTGRQAFVVTPSEELDDEEV